MVSKKLTLRFLEATVRCLARKRCGAKAALAYSLMLAATLGIVLATDAARAAITYNGTVYTQNFDSLPSTGTSAWTNDSSLPGWSLFNKTPVALTTIGVDNGNSNSGSMYSYGNTGSTNRALGSLGSGGSYWGSPASGTIAGWFAVALTNNTDSAISLWTAHFDGEQWRNGGNTNTQTMTLEYGYGSSFTAVTNWIVPGGTFNFTTPITGATVAVLDGTAAENRTANLGGTVSSTWAAGSTLWIRWDEVNDAGNDHAMAIDNFSFSTSAGTPASIGAITAQTGLQIITGGSAPFTFTVSNTGGSTLNFSASSSTNTTGSFTGPVAVTTGNTSLATSGLSFTGTSVGAGQTGSFTITDSAANNSPKTGTVSVNIYDHASPSASDTTVALQDTIVGFNGGIATLGSAAISNSGGFRVALKTTGATTAGPFVGIANVSGVAAGGSDSISAGANLDGTQSVGIGALNQTFSLTYADDSTLAGASANLGSVNINVTGNVLDHASPTLSPASPSFGRVMKNSSPAVPTTMLGNTSATARAGLQITTLSAGLSGASVNDVIASGGAKTLSIPAAATAATGPYSRTYLIGLSDDQSILGWTPLATHNFTVSGTVVDNRVVTGTPVNFGLVHVGQSCSGSTTLSTTGDNNHFTAVTVPGGSSGGVTVAGGTAVFNADGVSETRAVTTGALNSAGILSSSVVLSTNGENLSGEVPVNVSVPYSVQVFSGSGTWNSSSGSLWSDGGNWTDANGVQAAPGTLAGFADSDVATFSGSGSVTSISLSGANPGLKALSFSTSAYTLSDGTLTLGTGTATVHVADNTADIASSIAGAARLLKDGAGTLVLSGSNTYSGGTTVTAGTLIATNSHSLPDGMSLTVVAGGTLIFDPSYRVASPVSPLGTSSTAMGSPINPVPEPSTLVLLFAGLVVGFGVWRRS